MLIGTRLRGDDAITIQSGRESWLDDVAATPLCAGSGCFRQVRWETAVSTASTVAAPGQGPTISFELYPPRRTSAVPAAWECIERLAATGPAFFSVTSGSSPAKRRATRDLIQQIRARTGVPVVAHLTCIGSTRDELIAHVRELLDDGVRDVLALRGDPPAEGRWEPRPGEPGRAAELVALIREVAAAHLDPGDSVSVAVAAYPCGSARSREQELAALAEKAEAGADYAITQLFYEPEAYLDLLTDARAAGIRLPLLPGVIPFTDPGRLRRLADLTGVPVPPRLAELLAVADPAERHRRGVAATVDLAGAVIEAGAPGAHLYTFNRPEPALDVLTGLRARGATAGTAPVTTTPATTTP